VITKAFILPKDNHRISAEILRDNKLIHDHGVLLAVIAKRERPM
jgi:hypothetical protein